jgi:hypothetical protein
MKFRTNNTELKTKSLDLLINLLLASEQVGMTFNRGDFNYDNKNITRF